VSEKSVTVCDMRGGLKIMRDVIRILFLSFT